MLLDTHLHLNHTVNGYLATGLICGAGQLFQVNKMAHLGWHPSTLSIDPANS